MAYKTLRYVRYATSATMSFDNNVVLNDDDDVDEDEDDDDDADDDSDVSIVSTSQCGVWSPRLFIPL